MKILQHIERLLTDGTIQDTSIFFSKPHVNCFWVRTVVRHGSHVEGTGDTLEGAFEQFLRCVNSHPPAGPTECDALKTAAMWLCCEVATHSIECSCGSCAAAADAIQYLPELSDGYKKQFERRKAVQDFLKTLPKDQ